MRTLAVIVSCCLAAGGALVRAQSTTQPAAAAESAESAAPRPAARSERVPHPPPVAGEVRQLTIRELGNFAYDDVNGGDIPEDVRRLSGSTVRLTGYMLPMDQADQITSFALVPSLFDCCFGQPPQLQHTITVHVPPGKALRYYPEEIVCEGMLTVEEKRDGEWIVSLFELAVTSVKPAAK